MSLNDKKITIREESRAQTIQIVSDLLKHYDLHGLTGQIVIDIRSGKPIWVMPRVELGKKRVG